MIGSLKQQNGSVFALERPGDRRAAQVELVGKRIEIGDRQDVPLPRPVVEEDRVVATAGGDPIAPAAGMEGLARIASGQDVAALTTEDCRCDGPVLKPNTT